MTKVSEESQSNLVIPGRLLSGGDSAGGDSSAGCALTLPIIQVINLRLQVLY